MNSLVAWFARNHVAANLLMVVILAAGAWAAFRLPLEYFPEFESDFVTVSMSYRGATPAEVEESIVIRIEEAIADLPGLKRMTSTANEGGGSVTVQVEKGYDVRRMLDDIKIRVDSISTFPEETERPVVSTDSMTSRVISVLVSGDMTERELRKLGEQVRDDIRQLPGLTQVELRGVRKPEIAIEISEIELQRYKLTLNDVADAIKKSSLDVPAGAIRTASGEILLRTKGQAYVRSDFENILLRAQENGSRLLLKDVATVKDAFGENALYCRVNGKPCVLVQVYRTGRQNIIEIADAVKGYLETAPARLPQGAELSLWRDNSINVRGRLTMLLRDTGIGAVLVLFTLALMLRPSLAGWVVLGIPLGFAGGLLCMYLFGVTINAISLFGFIIVVGVVVDDAIVCGENIYTHLVRGKDPLDAAIDGARQVAVPVVFGVLSNVAAFTPILFLPGRMGLIYLQIPAVVIPVFLFSLLESTLILPARLRLMSMKREIQLAAGARLVWWEKIQRGVSGGVQRLIDRLYQPLLRAATRHRFLSYSIFLAALLLIGGVIFGGHITYTHMPPVYNETITAALEMPLGTPERETAEQVQRMHDAALRLKSELAAKYPGEPPIKNVMMVMGTRSGGGSGFGTSGSPHLGEVTLELSGAEARTLDAGEITNRWRDSIGDIPGAQEVNFFNRMGKYGDDIAIQVSGLDFAEMAEVSGEIQHHLLTYTGIYDAHDSFEDGKQEIQLKIKPEAEQLGLTMSDLARQARAAFYGLEAQRIQRGRDDLRIMVRYPRAEREALATLENMKIRRPDGTEVPFVSVAQVKMGKSFSSIRRTDRRRVITVGASADTANIDMQRIQGQIDTFLTDLRHDHPTLNFSFEGAARDERESFASLWWGVGAALFVLYGLLAIPFKSYLQPFVVISVIPFAVLGAVLGHLAKGINLSFFSILGMLALAGVAVNNGIILVDNINQRRAAGQPLLDAVLAAGRARFRAILLTSAVTFVGLVPLIFGKSTQALFLVPMAVSMGWGILAATVVTLFLVPLNYLLLADLLSLLKHGHRHQDDPSDTPVVLPPDLDAAH